MAHKPYNMCQHEDCPRYVVSRSVRAFDFCEEHLLARADAMKILMLGIIEVAESLEDHTRDPESDY